MLQKTYEENDYSKKFWEENEEYHEMVNDYYKSLEIEHPDSVTSRGACKCLNLNISNYCKWGASNVNYISHNGESI